MIPKKIHYCWFGGAPIPEKDKRCIDSWRLFCPDYEIIEWNESNYDINKNLYMKQAYINKKWGFVPDFARYDIIYTHGGIYLDTDVEILKPLDNLLVNEAFMGYEDDKFINGGIGFGAEKGNKIIKSLRDMYNDLNFVNEDGSLNLTPSPKYITDLLQTKGLSSNNTEQLIENVRIYPRDFFSPKEYISNRIKITDNTYTIHHFNASWKSKREIRVLKIRRIMGEKLFWRLVKLKKMIRGN